MSIYGFDDARNKVEVYSKEECKNLIDNSSIIISINMLDNSNWSNPINQRGEESYRGLKYSIDRWVCPSDTAALTVGDGFVLIQNDSTTEVAMFTQRLNSGTLVNGKAYTGVICLNDDTIISGSAVCASGGVALSDTSADIYMQIAPSTNYDNFRININPGKYARIKWVALYEGEYTADNLPVYQPKSYAEELLECSRYFFKFGTTANGFLTGGATQLRINVPTPAPMRTTPTVADYSVGGLRTVGGTNMTPTVTAASTILRVGSSVDVLYTCSSISATNNTPVCGYFNGALSADL